MPLYQRAGFAPVLEYARGKRDRTIRGVQVLVAAVLAGLGVRRTKAFLEFDRKPMASVSLAQVHHGVPRSGQVVGVITGDLDALEDLSSFIAALILGAALLVGVDGGFRLLGYPALSLVLFIAAAIAGITLAVRSVLKDRE